MPVSGASSPSPPPHAARPSAISAPAATIGRIPSPRSAGRSRLVAAAPRNGELGDADVGGLDATLVGQVVEDPRVGADDPCGATGDVPKLLGIGEVDAALEELVVVPVHPECLPELLRRTLLELLVRVDGRVDLIVELVGVAAPERVEAAEVADQVVGLVAEVRTCLLYTSDAAD